MHVASHDITYRRPATYATLHTHVASRMNGHDVDVCGYVTCMCRLESLVLSDNCIGPLGCKEIMQVT